MTEALHPNVRRVVAAGADLGFEVQPQAFVEHTRTADDAARAIGVEVAQIVKSLVFVADGSPVVALIGGDRRLDEAKLAAAAGASDARRATADQVRESTGYPIGGVPPFGHACPLATFVDQELLAHRQLWAAAGTPNVNFAIAPDELVRVTGGLVCDLARR
ncbi:MAG TPA: YbaK/EbsC family protein [Acidimicrobiales bacterium]|nr:YbaK/EbsC family protein [Acidimicrobiales bacterium]